MKMLGNGYGRSVTDMATEQELHALRAAYAWIDQQANELIARAHHLDVLAKQIDAATCALDRRERDLDQREADVLRAAKEIVEARNGRPFK